jgi:hypothetical protein
MANEVTRQLAPIGSLPGAGYVDEVLDQLNQAGDDLESIPAGDPYRAEVYGPLMNAHNKAQAVRAKLWIVNDALIEAFGANQGLVQSYQRSAGDNVPLNGFGSVADRDAAVSSEQARIFRDAKARVAMSLVAKETPGADAVAVALADALNSGGAALQFVSSRLWGPLSLRPDMTAADVDRAAALEREIRAEGCKWAVDYLTAALAANRPDRELLVFCAALLRVVRDVRAEGPIKTAARVGDSQGNQKASDERESALVAYNMIDRWYAENKPRSLVIGTQVLTAITSAAFTMCGGGNLAGMSAAQFANAFLNPEKQRDVTKFQVRSGYLAAWLPIDVGRCPPGYSPLSGSTTAAGTPWRMPASAA